MLSFLIPTVDGREAEFERLCDEILRQMSENGCLDEMFILVAKDNKEATIGAKRQSLLDDCETDYFVMIDDDDMIAPYYIKEVIPFLKDVDCITYQEAIYKNGKHTETADHSNKYRSWGGIKNGFAHVRTPFYKDIIKTSIAKKIGFSDMRYGEDNDFSFRLKQSGLIRKEHHIDKIMYIYNAPSALKPSEHNKRYGIR